MQDVVEEPLPIYQILGTAESHGRQSVERELTSDVGVVPRVIHTSISTRLPAFDMWLLFSERRKEQDQVEQVFRNMGSSVEL